MFKNRVIKFLLCCLVFLFSAIYVQAAIISESNIYTKIQSLQKLAGQDYISLINKSEMIGNRLDSFNLASSQYKNTVYLALEKLNNIPSQIDVIKNSSDFSDSDKQIQINSLMQEADSVLYDLDAQTMNYLFSLKYYMPSITYKRYVKKFQEFYNSLNLTGASI